MHIPAADEIEVTVLGRGFGESSVIHVGDGDWIVIDSLRDEHRRCAPLAYLSDLGVAPDRVKLIIATHWHDDHVAGMTDLYEAATQAQLAFPLPKPANEFEAYVKAHAKVSQVSTTSGIEEMKTLIKIRQVQNRHSFINAQASMTLYRKHSVAIGNEITLTTLSPSPKDTHEFLMAAGQAANQDWVGSYRLMPLKQNDISVAAWLSLGSDCVLFGADLEDIPDAQRGWNAVLASTTWPRSVASLYKVSHHGSETGHHGEVWNSLLCPAAHAAITPFSKSVGLPRAADQARLMALTPNAFITNQTPFRRPRHEPSGVTRAKEAAGIKTKSPPRALGRVTFRKVQSTGQPWQVQLNTNSSPLSAFVPKD